MAHILARERGPDLSTIVRTFVVVTRRRNPHRPAVNQEDVMHPFAADTAFQLASDRRLRLLGEVPRPRRLRRRPVTDVLPGSPPPDAA